MKCVISSRRWLPIGAALSILLFPGGAAAQPAKAPALELPFKITAGGEPIATKVGHAAPLVYDFDRDGKKDLIVGEFGGGRARIYLNSGTSKEPRFKTFSYLQGGGEDATVPSS